MRVAVLGAIALFVFMTCGVADAHRSDIVVCKSYGGYQFCKADVRGGRVALIRQFSRSPCVEGRTWGYSSDGIWVDSGCKGEFEVLHSRHRDRYYDDYDHDRYNDRYRGRRNYGRSYYVTLRCESENYQYEYCPVECFVEDAEVVRQYSTSMCIIDGTWGFDKHGVWVDGGCRAKFRVLCR